MPSWSAAPTKKGDKVEAVTEATPLLTAPESGYVSDQQHEDDVSSSTNVDTLHKHQDASQDRGEEKQMPYGQVLFLCYSAIAEPIAYFAIFPFINEMIELKGKVDEQDVGFWSGMIEALFSLVQMILMIFYGRAADRVGRKPVLVFSLTGVAIATGLFGMSQELWQMIFMRCLAGVFAGSVVTVRTMISENCTKENQGRAFSWYMFVRNAGIFVGPLIGGSLANPAEQFPSVFGGVPFWEKYPYALATFATGGVVLSAALTSLVFLEETLKRDSDGKSDPEPPMSSWEILKSPGVPVVLYIFGHMMLLALAYTTVVPVFCYTSIGKGGFGFSDQMIGLLTALAGGSQALWTLIAFPPLQSKFGTGRVMKWCCILWPFFVAAYPIGNELLRSGWTLVFWIGMPTAIVLGSFVSMAFACIQLCINNISPSPTVLGTLNALALTVNSGIRAFAPVLGTSIFAIGVKWGFADGHLVWFFLVVLAATLNIACRFLPEAAEGKVKKSSRSDGQAVAEE